MNFHFDIQLIRLNIIYMGSNLYITSIHTQCFLKPQHRIIIIRSPLIDPEGSCTPYWLCVHCRKTNLIMIDPKMLIKACNTDVRGRQAYPYRIQLNVLWTFRKCDPVDPKMLIKARKPDVRGRHAYPFRIQFDHIDPKMLIKSPKERKGKEELLSPLLPWKFHGLPVGTATPLQSPSGLAPTSECGPHRLPLLY